VYPALRGEVRADACVVGLGGSGLACVDELLDAGVSVVALDAGRVAGAAAGRNGGLLRAGVSRFHHDARARYGAARAARLYAATAAERERLVRRLPGVVRRCGFVRLASDPTEERDCRAQLTALLADGFEALWFDGRVGCGVLVPHDAAVNPVARCRLEAAAVSARGAWLHEQSTALDVNRGVVETAEGRVRCRTVIVAVDGGLTRLVPELANRVRPARLQMIGAETPQTTELPVAGAARWGWDYWQRLDDARIAFGGCRDVGGSSEWTADGTVTSEVQRALESQLERLTGQPAVVTHRWSAIVGYTDDGLPVLDQVRPGVWAVGAYSGTGNLLGAVCGRAVARLALGLTNESPLD